MAMNILTKFENGSHRTPLSTQKITILTSHVSEDDSAKQLNSETVKT